MSDNTEARIKYSIASFLFAELNNSLSIHDDVLCYGFCIIRLLDKVLEVMPDFIDAHNFREDVWHILLHNRTYGVDYKDYLQSAAWSYKKAQVLERDGHRCAMCNDHNPEVHHKTYHNIGKEPLSDLTSVCSSCHTKYHKDSATSNQTEPNLEPVESDIPFSPSNLNEALKTESDDKITFENLERKPSLDTLLANVEKLEPKQTKGR